ncbi:MAG: RNA-binding transcriptional accessory protein, partial [Clostridia bacterium]|nr:RNA-binding transcriptional accessory protein [Clostridia bacterium]
MDYSLKLSKEFSIREEYAKNVITLIDEGCTIPFIARYRKEMHGAMDDQVLRDFADRLKYLRNLDKRKQEIADSITEQGKMTDEIALSLAAAETMTEAEDIYRPYKQKRKTRASVAMERGLTPLADLIEAQDPAT